jgi:hypothetical protein
MKIDKKVCVYRYNIKQWEKQAFTRCCLEGTVWWGFPYFIRQRYKNYQD